MSGDGVNCSEETLSALLDDELEVSERRAAAIHVAGCSACARTLGHLCAARASVQEPVPEQAVLPPGFWRGVRLRLDEVDRLIRATDLAPQRPAPIISPRLAWAGVMAVILAVGVKGYLLRPVEVPTALTRLHFAASLGPNDPGLTQTVGVTPTDRWHLESRSMVNLNGIWALQTIYTVSGLAVSVFRLPHGSLNTNRLSPIPVGDQTLYGARLRSSTLIARPTRYGWDVVVCRSGADHAVDLCMTCPNEEMASPHRERTLEAGY